MTIGGGYYVDIYWQRHEECWAHYDDLFEPYTAQGVAIHRVDRSLGLWTMLSVTHSRPRNLRLPDLIRRIAFDASYHGRDIRYSDINTLTAGKRRIFINTSSDFCHYTITRSLARYFTPIEQIRRRIDEVTAAYAPNTIGVHIRRTDHSLVIERSPLEAFIRRMDRELQRDGDCMFYVATDDGNVKRMLKKRYGQRIISPDLTLSRTTTEGMRDAVAELFCLGHTRRIIGSPLSTFTTDAAALYDIPLTEPTENI